MLRRDCINFLTCGGLEITQVRDPFFAIDHELAFMPVCGTCFDEYMALDPSMGYYEIPMVDTQIKTDDITLRFSHAADSVHEPIRIPNTMMNLVTRCILFSDACRRGDKFAANQLGTFKYAGL